VGWLTIVLGITGVALVGSLIYLVSRRWFPRNAAYDLEPELSITRKNGWALLDLVLVNHSKSPIWAEKATFAVADLDADFQGAVATNEGSLLIRETVRPGGMLRISLIETVYNAAGKPQGEYSFLVSGVVRYRAHENSWFEISLQTYRIRMIALSAIRLLQMRWYDQPAAGGAKARVRRISNEEEEQQPRSQAR
jgi:hypothetical protein